MASSIRYRLVSVLGTGVIAACVFLSASVVSRHPFLAEWFLLGNLSVDTVLAGDYLIEAVVSTLVVLAVFVPLYKPQPRRILDTMTLASRRVFLALTLLATIGYFDYSYRLPRLTVIVATPLLLASLPAWFVLIRRRPTADSSRTIIVGDDADRIQMVARAADVPVLGYVVPPSVADELTTSDVAREAGVTTDGGGVVTQLDRLGGFSQLEEVLLENDIDTAVLAFEQSDRQEFFGALDVCYDNGVVVKTHRAHARAVFR